MMVAITVNGEDHEVPSPNMLVHSDIAKLGFGDDIMAAPFAICSNTPRSRISHRPPIRASRSSMLT